MAPEMICSLADQHTLLPIDNRQHRRLLLLRHLSDPDAMGEEYDVPWEYARRGAGGGGGVRASTMSSTMPMVSTTSHDCISTSSTSSLRYPPEQRSISREEMEEAHAHSMALYRPSSSTEGRGEGRRRSSRGGGGEGEDGARRKGIDESCIRRDMDRVEAEKILQERGTGDFVMRWREDGVSAALSLRAHEGVLHLKIDRVAERWIVGEGARFRSISQAISFYRKNPLPIRGARHICLSECLTIPWTTDARL
ncbi:hypothetical protein PENTCL1PPCAC_23785 [Pristionchus entomophagus]|uniref:SH2 domain-containing protein n=1 Tax=Pristionchus entomophagus TaxID=358040 RepID=A0AAV5U548_9BILA|nr:hypothetical protein PENTCL1PPCAC_23785 [Pristionchus entomophagus]